MAGDWPALWREKTGRDQPADLDFVAAVQIGIAIEHLHPRFVARATGLSCVAAAATLVHPEFDWMVAHSEFFAWEGEATRGTPDVIVEAKFSSGFQSNATLVERYWWKLQHQFLVTGMERGLLSILRPTGHEVERIERSGSDAGRLPDTLQAFRWHVANDIEPSGQQPVDALRREGVRVVDMGRHNHFAALAAILAGQRHTVRTVREAETTLKALMPDDARIAFANGVYVSRDRDGRLSLRYGLPPRRALEGAEVWTPEHSLDPSLEAVLAAGWGEGNARTCEKEESFRWAVCARPTPSPRTSVRRARRRLPAARRRRPRCPSRRSRKRRPRRGPWSTCTSGTA